MGEQGREGDWECGGCRNRNYAFRSLCNRCKQPRLLVDASTPVDSKWLPRIGDWICAGCSNNNYASREKCKKCGQSKEEAAMPAIALPGTSLSTYANYLSRAQGPYGSRVNFGLNENSAFGLFQQGSNWSLGGVEQHGLQVSFGSPLSAKNGFSYLNNSSQLLALPKGWRSGDWICDCGFHNYSSRSECRKCNAPLASAGPSGAGSNVADIFPTLGAKRLASEEFTIDWDNKRFNAGDMGSHFLNSCGQQSPHQIIEQLSSSVYDQSRGMYYKFPSRDSLSVSPLVSLHSSYHKIVPALLGKGAKQWRDGDWMCNNCNNHNYASRSFCNRCKTQKEAASLPVGAM